MSILDDMRKVIKSVDPNGTNGITMDFVSIVDEWSSKKKIKDMKNENLAAGCLAKVMMFVAIPMSEPQSV